MLVLYHFDLNSDKCDKTEVITCTGFVGINEIGNDLEKGKPDRINAVSQIASLIIVRQYLQ